MSDGSFMRYPPAAPAHAAAMEEDVFVSLTGRRLRDV